MVEWSQQGALSGRIEVLESASQRRETAGEVCSEYREHCYYCSGQLCC